LALEHRVIRAGDRPRLFKTKVLPEVLSHANPKIATSRKVVVDPGGG
jgi:hypothetical protein